jgi:hypothetical protein
VLGLSLLPLLASRRIPLMLRVTHVNRFTHVADSIGFVGVLGECQVTTQTVARRALVPPLMNRDFRGDDRARTHCEGSVPTALTGHLDSPLHMPPDRRSYCPTITDGPLAISSVMLRHMPMTSSTISANTPGCDLVYTSSPHRSDGSARSHTPHHGPLALDVA